MGGKVRKTEVEGWRVEGVEGCFAGSWGVGCRVWGGGGEDVTYERGCGLLGKYLPYALMGNGMVACADEFQVVEPIDW